MKTRLEVFVFLALIGVCSAAIKCYVCEYDSKYSRIGKANCGEEFKDANISSAPCGGPCQKKIMYPTEDDDQHFQIIRTCANDKCEVSDRDEIHCCDGDLCNAASPSAIYSFAFTLVTSVVAYLV